MFTFNQEWFLKKKINQEWIYLSGKRELFKWSNIWLLQKKKKKVVKYLIFTLIFEKKLVGKNPPYYVQFPDGQGRKNRKKQIKLVTIFDISKTWHILSFPDSKFSVWCFNFSSSSVMDFFFFLNQHNIIKLGKRKTHRARNRRKKSTSSVMD